MFFVDVPVTNDEVKFISETWVNPETYRKWF